MPSVLSDGFAPFIQGSETDLTQLQKCPVTVGEYPSIFLCYSLLTLNHLCNFTPRAPHALPVQGFSLSNARILRPTADPPTLLRRRFLVLATPEVPRLRRAGGLPPPPRPSPFLRPSSATGRLEVSFLLRLQTSADVSAPAFAQYHKRRVSVCLSQDPPRSFVQRSFG